MKFPRKKISRGKKIGWKIVLIFLIGLMAGFFNYPKAWDKAVDWTGLGLPHFYNLPFKLGLDLQGGTHLIYEADLSNISPESHKDSMEGIRDVIERRVNLFGVSEPVVQVNQTGNHYRLIVELAGVKDIAQAVQMIGQTPSLDFREQRPEAETNAILEELQPIVEKYGQGEELTEEEMLKLQQDPYYQSPQLTGRYLEGAQVTQDQMTYEYQVNLQFNDEGADLFEEITARNIGQPVAIYLDGEIISAPIVQDKITGGKAQITGNFSAQEARELAQRLNAGALPVPINLVSQQSVGAALGQVSLTKSLRAGAFGFLAVLLFMILYYRLPGLLASFALLVYLSLTLAVFKLISVTLTLAGIAGFILSIGLAVDANILIFERLKEELKSGKSLGSSIDDGFKRAWSAIYDGNVSTLITCLVLFIFATSMIKGFALTLGIGVLISMFTAMVVTKTFLKWFVNGRLEQKKWLWGNNLK